jgi:exodeoxyribonuclease V gamma subunit
LAACGEANTWRFGLRRMLLGYSAGELDSGHAGIEPYTEVAGLSAALAGALAELLAVLDPWWAECGTPRAPEVWGPRLRTLLQQIFTATDDDDRAVLSALDDALSDWLQACEAAEFEDPVDLAVVREAWLDAVDEPGVSRRFKAGGVTFCTLLPMRAIPFEVVCLLGMNDGDYPRRSARSDFDLMALAGQARPGDRSRRDDDRQLMLDALLSARRVLYVSWAGRSQRDNQEQPPSVLVSQLRDYLSAGRGAEVVKARTTEHPLQPFSRRYFEPTGAGAGEQALFTYAAEWRSAHEAQPAAVAADGAAAVPPSAPADAAAAPMQLTVSQLSGFLRNPVKAFFRQRLQVSFDERPAAAEDDEQFVTGGLDRWQLLDEVLSATRRHIEGAGSSPGTLNALLEGQVARLQRAGRLPMAGPGALVRDELITTLNPMVAQWQVLQAQHPQIHGKAPLRLQDPQRASLNLDDWLLGLQSSGEAGATPTWIELQASKLADKKLKNARPDKLLTAWVRSLAAAACGRPAAGIVIGADAVIHVAALEPAAAQGTLLGVMRACQEGLSGDRPWPTAVLTGLAFVTDPDKARSAYEGSDFGGGLGEGREACLSRLYPDFAALSRDPEFGASSLKLYAPYQDWLNDQVLIEELPDHADTEGDGDE